MMHYIEFLENRYGRSLTLTIDHNKICLHCGYTVIMGNDFEHLLRNADEVLTIFDSKPWEENCAKRIVTGILLAFKYRAKSFFDRLKKH